ncbi:hypothetical protein MIR68_008227 [Amoeboaphelidium protococcarum]|nr:hypothetical protein MIR68_008227 [Amoeboaphelidium protococcarum]KAI3643472.1 hypothetical protein MP228_013027 [Amoeboaphelidium protococcarum]
MFLFGANLPEQKLVRIALRNIFGIGDTKAVQICNRLSIHPKCKVKDLSEDMVSRISKTIEQDPDKVGHELQRKIAARCKHYYDIGSLRGQRLAYGLPVHGQSAHPNGKTAKKRHGQFVSLRSKAK